MLIGLTGGIATGKSTFTGFMRHISDLQFFDADAYVHHLLDQGDEVLASIRSAFGYEAFNSDGTVNKSYLRDLIYADTVAKKKLEAILHPPVRQAWMQKAKVAKDAGATFIADIPLLFETDCSSSFDAVVVVACSGPVQAERLSRRGISSKLQTQMLSSQLPLEEKTRRADHVVWNDGSVENLQQEAIALSRLFVKNV